MRRGTDRQDARDDGGKDALAALTEERLPDHEASQPSCKVESRRAMRKPASAVFTLAVVALSSTHSPALRPVID